MNWSVRNINKMNSIGSKRSTFIQEAQFIQQFISDIENNKVIMESNDSTVNLKKKNENKLGKKYYTNRSEMEKMPKLAERPKKLLESSRSRKNILSVDPAVFEQKGVNKTQADKVPVKSFQVKIN